MELLPIRRGVNGVGEASKLRHDGRKAAGATRLQVPRPLGRKTAENASYGGGVDSLYDADTPPTSDGFNGYAWSVHDQLTDVDLTVSPASDGLQRLVASATPACPLEVNREALSELRPDVAQRARPYPHILPHREREATVPHRLESAHAVCKAVR